MKTNGCRWPRDRSRREFLATSAAALGTAMLGRRSVSAEIQAKPLNVLFITADDMNWDSPGCYGNEVESITPNIDRLAGEGMRFLNGHVTIAVCHPSRQVFMTGRYPHRAGYEWFEPVADEVPILQEVLDDAGYINGCIGKLIHLQPQERYRWSMGLSMVDLKGGRNPHAYYKHTRDFLKRADDENRPFFLMVNSHDPHRPLSGSEAEQQNLGHWLDSGDIIEPSRRYTPDDITVPPFLPDHPLMREDIANFHSSVRRCDDTVGAVLRALQESGQEQNTLVMFVSDNGMPFSFAKGCVYLNSTRTPWIVRWPGHVKPGTVDREHFISGIDFMPTVLDALGLSQVAGMDGHSFLPVLRGQSQPERDHVWTVFYKYFPVDGGPRPEETTYYQMRCYQNKNYGYIFNGWSDGEQPFGLACGPRQWKAMTDAAAEDPWWAQRQNMFQFRVPEELYRFNNDPNAFDNLVGREPYEAMTRDMRNRMIRWMNQTSDPLLPRYQEYLKTIS